MVLGSPPPCASAMLALTHIHPSTLHKLDHIDTIFHITKAHLTALAFMYPKIQRNNTSSSKREILFPAINLYRLPMPNLSPITKSSETLSKQIIQKDQTHQKSLNLPIITPRENIKRFDLFEIWIDTTRQGIRGVDGGDGIFAGLWTESRLAGGE